MADTIFTRALAQGVAIHDSTQALAYALRVPEGTLLRWISGRAQMPFAAFHHLLRLLVEHERRLPSESGNGGDGHGVAMTFSVGEVQAQCAHCHGTEFMAPAAGLRMTSLLSCSACRATVMHADLLAALAREVAKPHPRVAHRVTRVAEALTRKTSAG